MFWSLSEVRRSILNGAQHRPCRCSLQTASPALPGEFLGVGPPSHAHDRTEEVEACQGDGWELEAADFLIDTRDQRVARAASYPCNTILL